VRREGEERGGANEMERINEARTNARTCADRGNSSGQLGNCTRTWHTRRCPRQIRNISRTNARRLRLIVRRTPQTTATALLYRNNIHCSAKQISVLHYRYSLIMYDLHYYYVNSIMVHLMIQI